MIMKKSIIIVLCFVVSLLAFGGVPVDKKYLAGAVPEENGVVVFRKTFEVPGKTTSEIYQMVRDFTMSELVHGSESGPQARLTQDTPDEGLMAASIEETMWFLRRPMRSDFTRFYYQIVYEVKDGTLEVMIRNLRYIYGMTEREEDITTLRAEEWITDKEALSRKGTALAKVSGKFRKATIDRKDEILRGIGRAVGAKLQSKTIVVEEY